MSLGYVASQCLNHVRFGVALAGLRFVNLDILLTGRTGDIEEPFLALLPAAKHIIYSQLLHFLEHFLVTSLLEQCWRSRISRIIIVVVKVVNGQCTQ